MVKKGYTPGQREILGNHIYSAIKQVQVLSIDSSTILSVYGFRPVVSTSVNAMGLSSLRFFSILFPLTLASMTILHSRRRAVNLNPNPRFSSGYFAQ